ncbi:MAG TPA: hypothetical protein VL286_07180, partial [Rhizomicrobium sp.]|nr:hypothetical protein [Rhizomicrobium sp.]
GHDRRQSGHGRGAVSEASVSWRHASCGDRVLELRESKSRPQNGIVVFAHRAFNQHDELVAHCKRSALMLRKPA